jgi:Transferase family
MLADIPVSVVYFFPQPLDEDRLAAGLAVALNHLPVFGGRLRTRADDTLEIVCGNTGVPMTTYDVDETLAEAIGHVALAASGYVDHIDASAARTGDHPLLTIRVSRLSDGSTALGCSWHHSVGDMQSFLILMRLWSAAVEGLPLPDVLVVPDRDAYLDDALPSQDSGRPGFRLPGDDEAAALQREVMVAGRANRTVQVYLGAEEVSRMRQKFSAEVGRALSVNDVLCAHLVTTVRQLDDDVEDRFLAIPVNVRRLLDLPATLIGNVLGEIHLRAAGGGAPETLAADIRAAVGDFAGTHLNLRANQAFLASVGPSRFRECVPVGFDPMHKTFTVSNWSRFGAYDIVFGGQQPVLFSPAANLQLPWVSWLIEGFENTGFLYTVVLPAKLAARLRGDTGRAALHRYREPGDPLPVLAAAVRKLV